MGELSKKVGQKIKQIRESLGIKQYELAEKLNMEPSNLTRIESGMQLPKEENLSKIAKALNVEVKDLFDFQDEISKEEFENKIMNLIKTFDLTEIEFIYNFIKMYKYSK